MAKGLTSEQRGTVKGLLLNSVKPRFNESSWQTDAAEKIGVDQSTINRLVKDPPMGGSIETAEKLAEFLNIPPHEILYKTQLPGELPRLRDLPGYAEAIEAARQRVQQEGRRIEAWALEGAGDFRLRPTPTIVTAELLLGLAVSKMQTP